MKKWMSIDERLEEIERRLENKSSDPEVCDKLNFLRRDADKELKKVLKHGAAAMILTAIGMGIASFDLERSNNIVSYLSGSTLLGGVVYLIYTTVKSLAAAGRFFHRYDEISRLDYKK